MDLADIYQFRQISRAHQSVSQVSQEIRHQREAQRDENQDLHDRVDRLTLLCEAMWNIISDRLEFTEDDLLRAVMAVDGSDGSPDGRKTKTPLKCDCGAMVHPRVSNCQFCGAPAPVRSIFDAV